MAISTIVSRKHARKIARKMAFEVAGIAYHLREISGVLVGLGEMLGPGTDTPNVLRTDTPNLLMRVHEILADDAEHLTRVQVFLVHLLNEAPRYSPTVAVAKQIGDGTSASR